jgi:WD40 repeat protein
MAEQPFSGTELPDPGRIASQQDFGRELTLARRRAGLTVRQVARASGVPPSTAGDYFAARHLPPASQPELLPRILAACGITSEAEVDRWLEALTRVRRAPGRRPAHVQAPYRGLASFQPEDAGWFFGREELALHLVRLATGPAAPGLPLAVVGPSGSGKSSLLRAGLIPRLRTGSLARPDGRPVVLITPGDAPLSCLAEALAPHVQGGQEEPALVAQALREAPERYASTIGRGEDSPAIIVDQFEETFTAEAGETGRQEFISALSALSGATLVVLGLRADFYGHALRYPELAHSLQDRQIVVSPMSAPQLRRAIMEPAHKAGLDVEDGLIEVLLADLRPSGGSGPAGHEAGALPLLSHALLATWERSHGGRLTLADYQASGGIRDAIARTADAAYAGLGEEEKAAARHLFLRLVHVADDARETRARVPLSDLPGDAATVAAVLERFVEERLVTLDVDTAEITHEALLDAWPRLRSWIDADREDIRARRFITTAAQAWEEAGREPAALLRGGQLALARDWAASEANRALLSRLAREFIDAGVADERTQQAAQRRRTRRLRQLVGALTALVLITVGLTAYAFQQRELATTAKNLATAAKNLADSRSVAIEADEVRTDDPALAAQLSLAAYRITPTTGALASLLESSGVPAAARMFDSDRDVQAVALSPNHHLLAVAAADGTLCLWNVSRPGHPEKIGGVAALGRDDPLYAAAFSPDGKLLAAAGADRKVRLWRVSDPRHPVLLGQLTGPASTIYSVAFSPDGRLLAAGSADDKTWLWDITGSADPAPAGTPLTGAAGPVQAVAFSPDGQLLAAGSQDKTVRLWNVANPAKPTLACKLTGPTDFVNAVAFSPDGQTLAAGSRDKEVWRWDIADPAKPVAAKPLKGATSWVNAVAFSPGGHMLAEGGSDGRVLVWNAGTGTLMGVFPHPQPVTSLAWDGPGTLVAGDADGYVRAWRVPAPDLLTNSAVNSIAYSPSGAALAVGDLGGLQLWNPATRTLVASASVPGAPHNFVNAVAYSPDGNLIATGEQDGQVQLWQPGTHPAALGAPLSASTAKSGPNMVEFVAFAAGGKILASGSDDGTVRLWNVSDPSRPTLLSRIPDSGTYVFSVAFSPNGHILAAASADDDVRLWNIASPARPRRLGKALEGPTNTAYSVAFSPSGRTLAVGSADRDVRLWDVADPARPRRIALLTGPSGYVYSVAFSPDGRELAAGNTDGSVWLWNLSHPASPSLTATLTGPTGQVYSVAFSPGGRTLAASDAAGRVWLWDTDPSTAAAAICAMSGQRLTRSEWSTYLPGRPYAPPCPAR